jgi:hypothetical protein
MGKFITRIVLSQGNAGDHAPIQTFLESDANLSINNVRLQQNPSSLEIEYRTSGKYSLAELSRAMSTAIERTGKRSSFFIIRQKPSIV